MNERKAGTGIYAEINKIAGDANWCDAVLINEGMVDEMAREGCTAQEIYDAEVFTLLNNFDS